MAYEAPQLHNKQAKMKPLLSVHYNHGFWFQKIVLVQKYQFFWHGERYSYKDLVLQLISEGIYLERITYITATIAGEEVK